MSTVIYCPSLSPAFGEVEMWGVSGWGVEKAFEEYVLSEGTERERSGYKAFLLYLESVSVPFFNT